MKKMKLLDRIGAVAKIVPLMGKAFRGQVGITLAELDALMEQAISGQPTFAGVKVTEQLALNLSAVWNGVAILAGTLASIPRILYKRTGSDDQNKERAKKHPLYKVLNRQANPHMTSFIWTEVSMEHALLWGNAYSNIVRNPAGFPVELWPINPARMRPEYDGELVYVFRRDNGTEVVFPKEDILHIPGLGFDGRRGYSLVNQMARQSIGTALAADEHAGRVFEQGATLRGYISHPGKMSDREGAKTRFRETWDTAYGGVSKAGKIAILEEGMKFEKLSMSPEDLQLLGTRTFNILEIARWLNLPPHKLKELTHATYSNIEEMQLEFIQDSVRPWAERFEAHFDWKLLNEEEKEDYFTEFMLDALLRGNFLARNQGLAVMRQNGALNGDEWRAMMNMNEIPDDVGKVYWQPMNMMDAANPLTIPKSKDGEDGKEDDEEEDGEEDDNRSIGRRDQVSASGMRSILGRRRIAVAHRRLFYNAMKRMLDSDRSAVEKIGKSLKERDILEFGQQIDEHYQGRYADYRREILRAYVPFADAIYPVAAREVNAEEKPTDGYDQEVERFVDASALRYVNTSRNQLKKVARDAEVAGKDSEEAVKERLDEWDRKRPDKEADRETVGGEAGLAAVVYFAMGFKLRWVAFGENCPYCDALDGRVVGRDESFLQGGQGFLPAGAVAGALVPSSNIRHPPSHQGCDCSVMASQF